MAITWAVTNLDRNVEGAKRAHYGLLTATGTTSDDGDAVSASSFGLSVLTDLIFESNFLDSTSNPENAFSGSFNPASGKVVLHTAHGTPGGAVPLLQVTDGTTVTGYSARVKAIGR